jgi:hypothetical protein
MTEFSNLIFFFNQISSSIIFFQFLIKTKTIILITPREHCMYNKITKIFFLTCFNFYLFPMKNVKEMQEFKRQLPFTCSEALEYDFESNMSFGSIVKTLKNAVAYGYLSSAKFHELCTNFDANPSIMEIYYALREPDKKDSKGRPDAIRYSKDNVRVFTDSQGRVLSVHKKIQNHVELERNKEMLRLLLMESVRMNGDQTDVKKVAKRGSKLLQKKRDIKRREERKVRQKREFFFE